MKRLTRLRRGQQGQSLIQVALLMTTLLALVALVVESGHLYSERRFMQNAADAGALAGARALCNNQDPVAAAREYAMERNSRGDTQAVDVRLEGNVVHVASSRFVPSIFGGIIGFEGAEIGARAAAACGGATSACAIWPLSFRIDRWDQLPCNTTFYVWAETNVDCTRYDCQNPVEVPPDAQVMPSDRGWLNFPRPEPPIPDVDDPQCRGQGCGSGRMVCYLTHDYPGRIHIGDCIDTQPGVANNAYDAAGSRAGSIVRIVLWRDQCMAEDCSQNGNGKRIEEFGCVLVGGNQRLTLNRLPHVTTGPRQIRVDVIRVTKLCDCPASNCGDTDGRPTRDVNAVDLLR